MKQSLRLWLIARTICLVAMLSTSAYADVDETRIPKATSSNVIVQLFNWKFVDIESKLQSLKDGGYSYVLVSPPEKSSSSTEWWGRYQPVDFTKIEGPLGDAAAFKKMNQTADQLGLKIIVDVVLNHMANDPAFVKRDQNGGVTDLVYPRFSKNDFHLPVVSVDQDRMHGWLGGDLPDLNTESSYVRQEAKNYLTMLVNDFGVDGFRFDAAKHIEDGFFEDVLTAVPRNQLFIFGEWVTGNPKDMTDYLDSMDAYDFPLSRTMKVAFAPGGDLRDLKDPGADNGKALEGVNAVTFVRTHDMIMNPDSWDFFMIGGKDGGVDEELAYAFILGRQFGTPFVYFDKLEDPIVKAGVRFHDLAMSEDTKWIVIDDNHLAWQRGTKLFAVINKAGEKWVVGNLQTSLESGDYVDLVSRTTVSVDAHGVPQGLTLEKSSAALLTKLLPRQ